MKKALLILLVLIVIITGVCARKVISRSGDEVDRPGQTDAAGNSPAASHAPDGGAPASPAASTSQPGPEESSPSNKEKGESSTASQENPQSSRPPAEESEETADRIWTYPVNVESPEWKDLDMSQVIAMCQMPEDLLKEASDAELAELLLDYPYILNYMAWNSWKDFFELDLKRRLNIAVELFSRDGANDALIDAYAGLEVDYVALAKNEDRLVWHHSGYSKQMFLEQYFYLYMSDLTDTQKEKLVYAALDRIKKEEDAGLIGTSMSGSFNRWMRLEKRILDSRSSGESE